MNRSSSVTPVQSNRSTSDGALERWLVALCSIRFDLERGQIIEDCYPSGALSTDEELDVAFSAFPDSMCQSQRHTSIHDCIFFFRIRRRGGIGKTNSNSVARLEQEAIPKINRELVSSQKHMHSWGTLEGLMSPKIALKRPGNEEDLQVHTSGKTASGGPGSGAQRYLYGFVFNRQRKDERLKRGGEQKSVVILSERPYSCVFIPLVQIVGPLYFDIGPKALEKAACYVSHWPAPKHGALMELPILSVTIKAHFPPAHTLPPGCGTPMDDFTSAMAPVPPLNRSVPQGIFQEFDLFGLFRGLLMELWILWELILIGEPMLLIASTPSQCSEAVAALVGLIAPLPCSIDFRPYFTIHDPDFHLLNSLKDGQRIPPMILGVTNFYFLKSIKNLPHVLSIGLSPYSMNTHWSNPPKRHAQMLRQLSQLKWLSPNNLLKVVKIRKDGPASLMMEQKEALWTTYVPTTKPDTSVLNRLVDAAPSPRIDESMSVVNNEVLRRHFQELTTNFLAPFGPYLRATAPQEGASPFGDPPPLPPFDAHEFLENLGARGPGKFLSKRLRANWLDLYRCFMGGPNFMPWFQRRRAVTEEEQHRIWRQARAKTDIRTFLATMSEVEIIDSFHAIAQHLLSEMQLVQLAGLGSAETPTAYKLRSDLRMIFNTLPKDMQQSIILNPQHAALLQNVREHTKLPLPGRPSPVSNVLPLRRSNSVDISGRFIASNDLVNDLVDLIKC